MAEIYDSSCDCEETVAESARRAIQTGRGEFYPDPGYGSKISEITSAPEELYALCFARQAVCEMDGVYALCAEKADGGYKLTLSLNGSERQVMISV